MRLKGERNRLLLLMVGICALVAGFMAYIAWAQERKEKPSPEKASLLIGWIDLERLFSGMEEYRNQSEIFDRMLQRRDEALKRLSQHFLFLPEAGWNEAANLLVKEKQTEKEKGRLEELRKESQRNEARWRELSQKAQLTPEEGEELKRLGNYLTSNRQKAEELRRKWLEELREYEEKVMAGLEEKVAEMARKIAEQKGFDVVLAYTKQRPPNVIYVRPDLNLTEPVVEALNKAYRAKKKQGEGRR